jgi:hypothetical protein
MTFLRTLEHELRAHCAIFEDLDRAEPDRAAAVRRVDELTAAINAAAPESLRDCALKLRIVADGIAMTDRDDDRTSLRQVIAFLEWVVGD